MSQSPRQVFTTLTAALADRRWRDAAALYAQDVVVTNPFDTAGPTTSVGRTSVERFYEFLAGQVSTLRAEDVTVHESTDSEVIVAECRFVGTAPDGADFERPAVFILRVRDGLIVESRDYMGPRRPR